MKKIALLCTILIVGAVSGMESGRSDNSWEKEVNALMYEHKNLRGVANAINDIKENSVSNKALKKIVTDGMYANQKEFTRLMHILADRFVLQEKNHVLATDKVATMLNTPAAKLYLELGNSLLQTIVSTNDSDSVAQLIKKGADINFSQQGHQFIVTPLSLAMEGLKDDIVKLLLEAGVKPWSHNKFELEQVIAKGDLEGTAVKKAMIIKQMLQEAMKKPQK